jgi:hypothetical protein
MSQEDENHCNQWVIWGAKRKVFDDMWKEIRIDPFTEVTPISEATFNMYSS